MILILYRSADSLAYKTVIFLRFSCERGQAVRCSDVCMCVNDMFQFCPSLLSPEAPFCHRERRKRKRAVDDGKGKEISPFPSSPVPLFFVAYCYFHWDTQRSLCGEERFCVVAIHTVPDRFFWHEK